VWEIPHQVRNDGPVAAPDGAKIKKNGRKTLCHAPLQNHVFIGMHKDSHPLQNQHHKPA